jgi:four helix bundle protein
MGNWEWEDKEGRLMGASAGGSDGGRAFAEVLRERTKLFALRVVRMVGQLPRRVEAEMIAKQVLRSATGVAANYREASRARSRREMVSKLGIVEQELDETLLWLELLVEAELVAAARLEALRAECEELLKIMVACIRSLKRKPCKDSSS